MRVEFVIPGTPMGKQRPKFSTVGRYVKAYTPAKTVNYENLVKLEYERQCGDQRFADDAPIYAMVTAHYEIPKSTSKKKRSQMLTGEILPMKKPDADNILKVVFDSLNNIAYKDDAQIIYAQLQKKYSDTPNVSVILFDMGELEVKI